MPAKTYIREDHEYYVDTDERVWSRRYREIRDGITGPPAQILKDDPQVSDVLAELDKLEQTSRPALGFGLDDRGKDWAAFHALFLVGWLVDYVAGWAIDHQRGLAQKGLCSLEATVRKGKISSPEYNKRRAAVDLHDHERTGTLRDDLDPLQARKFLFNVLLPMSDRLGLPHEIIEAIEALDFGETLPILQRTYTTKRTGLIEYRAKLSAIAFIEYEKQKGTLKHKSTEQVIKAFAVTGDVVKDWKTELRIALGALEVDHVLERARFYGKEYTGVAEPNDEIEVSIRFYCEEEYGKPALLAAAKRYKARSKKS